MLPLSSPPINGFIPQVAFGLTDEQDPDDLSFAAHPSSTPGGLSLPVGASPRYFVGTFDTGAQAHLVSYADAQVFDLPNAGLEGNYFATIQGVNGTEDADISDGLGIYMTGLANTSVSGGSTINVNSSTLRGQWNCSILTGAPGSQLPNLIGAPMAAQYQTVIRNSQTRHINVGSTTFRSPDVSFQALNTAAPQNYYRLTLSAQSVNGVSPDPVFFPSLDNFDNWADNPTTPSFWANLTALANASHTGGSSGSQDFLFDTGAQVTVVSEDTAAQVGFYTGGPNPTPPDFFVEVLGVGGTSVDVPGFYMSQLSVTTNGGPLTWTHVPVLVLNVPDPRDGVGFIPGILGMNLFTDRDLIINGGLGNAFVAISPQIAAQWTATGGGTWSDDTKWSLGAPDGADVPANFLSSITSPSTITVDAQGFTAGSMKFDNANRYTVAGPGTIALEAFSTGTSAIDVVSGSHTVSAPLLFRSPTTINVAPTAAKLTLSGSSVNAGTMTLTKIGAGAVDLTHARAGALTINAGTVSIIAGGSSASTSRVGTLTIAGGAAPTATLDLNDNDLVLTSTPLSTVAALIRYASNDRAWNRPGLTSSSARSHPVGATTLGAISAADYIPEMGSTFSGQSVTVTDVLVKYTWFGDTELDGVVSFDDYVRIDTGFNTVRSGWFNGDFDLSGTVEFDDYALIDLGFNAQNGTLRRAQTFLDGTDRTRADMTAPGLVKVLEHFDRFGIDYATHFLAAVPEPALVAVGFGLLPFLRRARRDGGRRARIRVS